MYLNVNEAYSAFDSSLAKEEKNDCVVRSVAVASGSSYIDAHSFCKDKFGREDKRGTNNLSIVTQMMKFEEEGMLIGDNKFKVEVLGKAKVKNRYKLKGEVIFRKKTLKSFISTHMKGTYLIMIANHALTVKDGEVYDWKTNTFKPTTKVTAAYELIEKDSSGQLSLFE